MPEPVLLNIQMTSGTVVMKSGNLNFLKEKYRIAEGEQVSK